MAVYAYYRVSTQTQAEQNGIQMQEDVVRGYCLQNGIEIAGEYSDLGVSGTIANREGLSEMLANLSKGDKVVVQNTSRLWRNETVKVMLHHELKKMDCDIISVEQPTYTVYVKDPNDFLVNGMLELLDQYERMTISMKLAKGRKARAKTGNKPCGTAPFGYKWDENKIVIDWNNNLIVKDIFEKYIEFQSLSALKDYCNKNQYKTSTGKDFSKQSLKNILNNDFYIGIVTYADKKVTGEHEAIVSDAVYEKANEILGRLSR